MDGARLPGAPVAERIVMHVDMDCFYAACERRREPSLAGVPVVVGMGYEPGEGHGAVATASYEAREHGVESAQPISQALERLPRADEDESEAGNDSDAAGENDGEDGPVGYYRPVDIEYYESVSEEVRAVLHEVCDVVREVSIDEAYLDVTEQVSWAGAPVFARSLKERIEAEAGVPASVGVAPNMSAAKLASDHDKPDGLVVVEPDDLRSFLAPIPIEDVHGVGPVTARELRGMGIGTAGDLAGADRDALVRSFGERGRDLHDRARGVDPRPVEPVGDPKSLSSESAFTEPTEDHERVREKLLALADEVCDRTEARDVLYKTIGVKVVTPPFDVHTRARSLSGPVQDRDLVRDVVVDLAAEFEGRAVRKVGARVSKLSFGAEEQASLDGWERGGDGRDAGESDDAGDGEDEAREWSRDGPAARRGQTTFGDFETD